MTTLTDRESASPQRVRQFFVPSTAFEARETEQPERSESEAGSSDLPSFLKNRSLRRRLDAAFDACHQNNVTGWFRYLFRLT